MLSAIVLIALHSHALLDPLDDHPISGGHHCLLCIAAHLPQAVSSNAQVLLLPNSSAVLLASGESDTAHEARLSFSLYMRPPPAR